MLIRKINCDKRFVKRFTINKRVPIKNKDNNESGKTNNFTARLITSVLITNKSAAYDKTAIRLARSGQRKYVKLF